MLSVTHYYDILAFHPECDIRGKWPLHEDGLYHDLKQSIFKNTKSGGLLAFSFNNDISNSSHHCHFMVAH